MQRVQQEQLLTPGECLVCHAGNNREWFLDTGIYLDYVGALYICNYCAVDFVHAVDGLTHEELIGLIDAQKEEVHNLQEEIVEMATLHNNVAALLPLTFKQILENLSGPGDDDRVSDEPELELDVAVVESDGSDEQAIVDTVDFKLAALDGAVTGFTGF